MKKIFTIMLLLLITNVKTYENNYFKIDIPKDFTQNETKEYIYKWTNKSNEHENIVVTVTKNEKHQQIIKYTDNDIKEYKKYLKEQFDKELKEYNINIEINDIKKEIINDIYNLNYNIYWPTKDIIGYNIYQKGYIFTTNNFIYVFYFTSDKDLNDNSDLNTTINSFKPYLENNNYKIIIIIIIGSLLAIISTIIRYIKNKKHKSVN